MNPIIMFDLYETVAFINISDTFSISIIENHLETVIFSSTY